MRTSLLHLMRFSLAVSAYFLLVFGTQAQVRVPFTQRTSAFTPTQTIYSIHGDFTMIGNTNMTLVSYSDTELNSNNDMKKVDTDGIASTNNSSSATLTFSNENGANPACSEILFAGLYWTARTNNTPTELDKRSIKFRGPGEASYTSYVATTSNIRYPGDNSMYVGFVEVTEKVQQRGLGQYWVADMALTTGDGGSTGYYGGWGMVVVYANSKMQKRDITIFDGYAFMDGNQDLSFELPVSGFNSTLSGAVNTKLGLMAGEGDVTITGDQFEIQKLNTSNYELLSHGGNATNNFFNSSIFTGGNARNPNLLNNTGMDISMFTIPNPGNSVIGNGQTNTKFRYTSTQDTYIIYSICMAVDAYEPAIEGFLSTVSVNGIPASSSTLTVEPGDEITYNVKIRNRGNEPVNNTRLEIPLPYSAVSYLGSTVNVYAPASSSSLPYIDALLSANGSLVWDFGTLPVPANEDDVLGEVTFSVRVSEDCDLYRNFNCAAPSVDIDGTISGVGANTGIAVEDQRFYVGFSNADGCTTEPVTGPFVININSTAWVAANCPAGDDVRDFSYCNRTTPISITEVLGFYPAGTRFFNTAGTIEYTIANPFPNVAGPTTYKAQLPEGGCQLTFTIAVTTITSVPSVAAGTLEYCQNAPAAALTATASNPSYTLYYYAPSNGATQPSIVPATDVVGNFTYQVAEGPSSTCISSNRVNIPVTILELPTITATPEQPICFGQTGIVVLASSGGTGTLTYSAINPATSGLTAGSYTYSVSDSKNCRSTATAVINAAPDQPAQPTIDCWETATWNSTTCEWEVSGEQDARPTTECWETATFNNTSCEWEVTGEQDAQPTTECWETATFNNESCEWEVSGEQDARPTTECWETATFNNTSCEWEVTGEQDAQPTTECWETATFNNTSCEWEVSGEQDAQPTTECWETATFNNESCAWEVTGEQDARPATECWETATFNNTSCEWEVTGEQDARPATECWETATFNNTSCEWEVSGEQDARPATECWETATFNNTSCAWEVTGEQDARPVTECWETATFNNTTCEWEVTGEQDARPVTECWETATFNNTTCEWEVSGEQDARPATECWETATFNNTTCEWEVTGEQDARPVTECWETATFNNTTCEWEVTGEQDARPTTECWETASFNNESCEWEVTGEQDARPTTECWETASFNNESCEWEVSGEQDAQPTTECWETASFNNESCEWEVSGEQDAQPTTECWETATFNNESCEWEVTGEQDARPTTECWETATFNNTSCAWEVTGEQDVQPTTECWETATFNNTSCAWEISGEQPEQPELACYEVAEFDNTICEWVVTIVDTTVPTISAPGADATIECPATPEFTAPSADDECGEATVVEVSDITTEGSCEGTYSRTITWKAVDNFGNESATVSQTITVVDTTAPVIAPLTNGEVSCGEGVSFETATTTDNCDSDVTITFEDEITGTGGCGYTTYSKGGWGSPSTSTPGQYRDNNFDAAFPSGLTIGCSVGSFTFTNAQAIEDYIPSGGGAAGLPAGNIVNPSALVYSNNFADQLAAAVLNVTFDAYDESFGGSDVNLGDLAFASGTFAGMTANQVIAIANDAIGGCGASYSNVDLSAAMEAINLSFHEGTENSGALVCGSDETECSYTAIRTWTATDNCGNTSTATQTITVVDNVAPVISAMGESAVIYCPATPEFTAPTATDNCSEVEVIVIEDATYEGDCAGTYSRTITWAAEDACGNRSENVSQTITVVDITAPSISLLCGDTTITCPSEPVFAQPTASDDCDSNPAIIVVSDETVDGPCAGTYARTIVWAAQDACGNMSEEVSQTITVVDETAPSISAAGEDATIECPAVPEFIAPTASDDCDSNPAISCVQDTIYPGTCAGSYVHTKAWVASDACGNFSEIVSQTITVVDTTAPSISAAGDNATIECPATPEFTAPTADDNCSDTQIVEVSDVTEDGDCAGTYTRTKTWKAVDACGNESEEVSQTITVVDTTAPAINAAGDNATIECPATPEFTAPTADDNCSDAQIVEVSDVTEDGDCAGTYTRTKTWKAVDACGNESEEVSQTITVVDTTAPVFTEVAPSMTIECPATPEFTTPSATDNCSYAEVVEVSDVTEDGTCAGSYTRTKTWIAIDACGNESEAVSQAITVVDTTAPVISLSSSAPIADGMVMGAPSFNGIASDYYNFSMGTFLSGSTGLSGWCPPNSYTWWGDGSTIVSAANSLDYHWIQGDSYTGVTWTLPYASNQVIAFGSIDHGPVPAEAIEFQILGSNDGVSWHNATLSQVFTDGWVNYGTSEESDDWSSLWTFDNDYTFVKAIANYDGDFEMDGVAAAISRFDQTVFECPYSPEFSIPTATDACSNAEVVEVSDVTEEADCAGSYTRTKTWKAVDACGNESEEVTQTVTIVDTTAPVVISAVADQFVQCGGEIVLNNPTFADACDLDLTIDYNESTDTLPQGIVITRTFTATDDCGNSVTDESLIVIAIENDPILLELPELNIQVSCDSIPQASIVIGEDVCGNELVVDFNEEITGDNCNSVITRTWTAVDSFGNESSYTQTITVTDETAPVISAAGADATIECPAQPVFTAPTATDNCNTAEVVEVSDVTEEGSCDGTYTRTKTWKAIDACGNESEYVSQTITVVDNTSPVVNAYSMEITVHCDQIPNIPVLTATDACSNVVVDYNEFMYSGGCPGTVERNYTFTDACGNVSEATQFITIIDTVGPVFTFVPAPRYFACGETYTAPDAAQATDICDNDVDVDYSSAYAPSDCPQQQLLVHTWTASDDCQNETVVTVTDVITICPEAEEVTACDQYEWFGEVYTASGSYSHIENENGCDIAYALDLTINQSDNTSFTAEACVSYTWNGVPYTVSGDYTQVFENAAGCDSTVTLHLTINQPTSSQQSATACGSYTWNGQTYTTTGVYQFETVNAAGCDSIAILTLTINTPSVAATSINVTPSASIISGNSVVLTVVGGSLGTGAVWKWYRGSCGGTFVGTGNSITVSPTSTTTYFVRAEGLCNTTACVSRTITVTPPCGPQSLVSNAPNNTTCYGTAVTLTVGGALQTGGTWKWYKNACGGICVGSGTNLVVMPTTTTTYYVRSEGGTCGTTTCMSITVIVNMQPARPSYITGLTSGLCNRTGVTYCTPAVSGATSYQWSVPTGATIVSGQGTTCITVNFSGSLGSNSVCGYAAICVRAVNPCGMSQARCVNLSVAPSGYATISGMTYVNQGSTATYSVGAISGATNYTWSVPSGWQIVSGQGTTSITVIVGANMGNVSVIPSNACASGMMIKRYVIVTSCAHRDTEVADIVVPDVNIYPNPANDYFMIDSGDAIPVYVEVMDMTGKVVFNGSQIRQVEVNNWTNGIYFVRMYFEDQIQTKRIEILH